MRELGSIPADYLCCEWQAVRCGAGRLATERLYPCGIARAQEHVDGLYAVRVRFVTMPTRSRMLSCGKGSDWFGLWARARAP